MHAITANEANHYSKNWIHPFASVGSSVKFERTNLHYSETLSLQRLLQCLCNEKKFVTKKSELTTLADKKIRSIETREQKKRQFTDNNTTEFGHCFKIQWMGVKIAREITMERT